jgi:hypothetical protein
VLRVLVRKGGFTTLHLPRLAGRYGKNGTVVPHEPPKESTGLRA